jgi:putative transposase
MRWRAARWSGPLSGIASQYPAGQRMKQIGIRGAVRGKVVKTTVPDTSAPCPRDKVNRVFRVPAPNLLWVSDFTYMSTWQGFVHVAFVIDTFADRIVG